MTVSVAQEFKVGQRVRFTERAYLSAGAYKSELGTIVEVQTHNDFNAYVMPDRGHEKVYVQPFEIEVVHPAPPAPTTFKVGDRVRLVERFSGGPGWVPEMDRPLISGEVGTVEAIHGGDCKIKFPSMEPRWFYPPHALTLIPDTLTHDGQEYTVSPNADGTLTLRPVRREAKQGEVWRDEDGDLYLVGDGQDDNGALECMYLNGTQAGIIGLVDLQTDVLAYESLPAAIAAQAIN